MDIRYKESIKQLPVDDFIVRLKKEEILAAAKRAGYDFGEKLPKKALVARLAQVYSFFPQQVRKCLSGEALELLESMQQNDCEAVGGAQGEELLLQMGMAMLLKGDDEAEVLVTSRRLLQALLG